eukprot:5494084-Amphidinium_carterae.2
MYPQCGALLAAIVLCVNMVETRHESHPSTKNVKTWNGLHSRHVREAFRETGSDILQRHLEAMNVLRRHLDGALKGGAVAFP